MPVQSDLTGYWRMQAERRSIHTGAAVEAPAPARRLCRVSSALRAALIPA